MPRCSRSVILIMILAIATTAAADSAAVHLRRRGEQFFAAAVAPGLGSAPLVLSRQGSSVKALPESPHVPPEWAVIHASLTVAPLGPGSAISGLNDEGLVVHLGWREGLEEGSVEARALVDAMHWVRFALDRHSRASHLIDSEAAAAIVRALPAQILICDSNGVCGLIERDGEKVERRWGELLPHRLITGASYRESVNTVTRARARGVDRVDPSDTSATARFQRAASRADTLVRGTEVITADSAAEVLAIAAPPGPTVRLVYDQRQRVVTLLQSAGATPKVVPLRSFPTTCGRGIPPTATVSLETTEPTLLPAEGAAAAGAVRWAPLHGLSEALIADIDTAAEATACLADDPETANPHGPRPTRTR